MLSGARGSGTTMNYSILDASNDFCGLSNSIGRFKEVLCNKVGIDFKSQDFRLVFLDSIQQILLSLTSYVRAFVSLQGKVSSPDEFLRILNVGICTVEEFEASRLIYKFPIEALVTMAHFHVDSFLGDLCTKAGTPKTGFYRRMKCVLDGTSLEDKQKRTFQNTLQCLAFFRNSFHNAGYHRINSANWRNRVEPAKGTIDREFTKDGFTIKFSHRELAEYNWRSAFLLIQDSVDNMQKIIWAMYGK